jgi:S1-C subfamily serine protease
LVDSKDRTLTVVDYAVSADPGVDACILKIKRLDDGPLDYPGTKISASELPMDALVIIGSFSGGGNYSIRSGRFYLEDFANIDSQRYLVTFINIPIEGGASGSGAVNSSGELVGIVSARSSRETLLVPLSKIKTFLFKAEETKRFRE